MPAAWKIDVKSCARQRNIRHGETRLNICAEAVFLNNNFKIISDEEKNKTVHGTAQKSVRLIAVEQDERTAFKLFFARFPATKGRMLMHKVAIIPIGR